MGEDDEEHGLVRGSDLGDGIGDGLQLGRWVGWIVRGTATGVPALAKVVELQDAEIRSTSSCLFPNGRFAVWLAQGLR